MTDDPARERAEKWLAEKMLEEAFAAFTEDGGREVFAALAKIAADAIEKVVRARDEQIDVAQGDGCLSTAGFESLPIPWDAVIEEREE